MLSNNIPPQEQHILPQRPITVAEYIKNPIEYNKGILDFRKLIFDERGIKQIGEWLCRNRHYKHLIFADQQTSDVPSSYMHSPSYSSSLDRHSYGLPNPNLKPSQKNGKKIEYKNALAIADLFKNYHTWREIDMSHNSWVGDEWIIIFNELSHNKLLRTLDLSDNLFDDHAVRCLAKQLPTLPKLKYLHLSNCNISENALGQLFDTLPKLPSLRVLNISGQPLSPKSLAKLLEIAKNNFLLEIRYNLDKEYSHDNYYIGLANDLKTITSENEDKRKKYYKDILSEEKILVEAFAAIEADDTAWLEILLGIGSEVEEQEKMFEDKKASYLEESRLLGFKFNLLTEQLNLLNQVEPDSFANDESKAYWRKVFEQKDQEVIQNALQYYRAELDKIKVVQEEDKKHFNKPPLLTDEELNNKLKQFEELITSCASTYKIQVSNRLSRLDLANKLNQQLDAIKFEERNNRILNTRQYQLLHDSKECFNSLLQKLDTYARNNSLFNQFDAEYEEIRLILIQPGLNPNAMTKDGRTLLAKAVELEKLECVKILLRRGADPAESKEKIPSLLDTLLHKTHLTPCEQYVIQHMKKNLSIIWYNILGEMLNDVTDRLNELKTAVDQYIDSLFNSAKLAKPLQLLTGHWHVKERQDDCQVLYRKIRGASHHQNEESQEIINEIIKYSASAKRGWRRKSQLHDKVIKIATAMQQHMVSSNYPERLQTSMIWLEVQAKKLMDYQISIHQETEKRIKAEKQLTEKDEKLKQTENQLTEKDEKLKQTENQLTEKDEKLKQTENQLNEKDEKLKQTENQLNESKEEIQRLLTQVEALKKTSKENSSEQGYGSTQHRYPFFSPQTNSLKEEELLPVSPAPQPRADSPTLT